METLNTLAIILLFIIVVVILVICLAVFWLTLTGQSPVALRISIGY